MSSILFIPHGGGPLPLLAEPSHFVLTQFLKSVPQLIEKPKAILMISAHWEADIASISSASAPEMIYDYSGFPDESYLIQYPAPGYVGLANQVKSLLNMQGIEATLDANRGFDHGTFVPLKLMYPEADIPVVQLSLVRGLNAAEHIQLGKAIATLSQDHILIVGSGSSFHNLNLMRQAHSETEVRAQAFDVWLNTILAEDFHTQEQTLIHWDSLAPYARFCHPREEHLLPLHVCVGAALANNFKVRSVFREKVMGIPMSGFQWS